MKADDLTMFDSWINILVGIDEMDTCGIRGVAVGNNGNLLMGLGSADGLIHGGNGRLGSSVVGDMIGSDFQAFRRDKKEDVIMFAHDLDIGFMVCAYRVYRAFMLKVKAMAVESGSGGIIEYSLIRDIDIKDRPQDESGFSGRDSERDVEREDKAEDIGGVMDFGEIDFGFIGLGMEEIAWLVMVLSILIAEFKL